MKRKEVLALAVLLPGMMLGSCGHKESPADKPEDILVEVGDSALTLRDVLSKIPAGLSEEDSTEMFHSLVDHWLRNLMLSDIAKENEREIDRIDRMVEDYRNSLIIERYLRSKEDEAGEITEQEIKEYYNTHQEELVTSEPLIKGIYLKVSDDERNLDQIRKWMTTGTPESVDKIEKEGLRQASQYEYFMDRWVDWSVVSEQIPYRFFSADAFLKSTKDFETSYAGSVYLLHIEDYLPSGSAMPEDYAASHIADILTRDGRMNYRASLLTSLYKRGIKAGRLKPGLYNPLTGTMNTKK